MNKQTTVGVIGAGSMGSGIAQIAATQEHQVVLVDLNDAALAKAEASLNKILARLVEKEKIDAATSEAIIGRIQFSNNINDFSDCGIVIEAIVEKLEVKIEKIFELHEKGQIETDRFNEFYDKPNREIKRLKMKIPELEGEIFALNDQFKSSGYIIEEARSLYENWSKLTKLQKRKIIEIITEKIIVGEQEIAINLNYILPKTTSFKTTANGLHKL